jgi:hypothetical protein
MNLLHLRSTACAMALAASLAACSRQAEQVDLARRSLAQAPAAASKDKLAADRVGPEGPLRRHIAMRHELQIGTTADGVEAAWRSASEACAEAGCEVLNSSLTHDDERRPAQALLEARVPPDKLDGFLRRVTALGSVGQHATTAVDKTDEVVDTEALIKNTTAFRDHLRELMATPGAKLRDLIEAERELVRVQSELDSLASRRKALAGETGKVHVRLTFTARATVLEQGLWWPVKQALADAGHIFARSVAGLIEFVVAVLPWSLLLVGAGFGLRTLRRRWRARRVAAA